MPKFTRKKAIAVVTTALVLGISGTAYAYWTQAGAGTGSATTAPSQALIVKQTSPLLVGAGLYPGGPALPLAGNFDNPNSGPATVGVVSGVVASVTKAVGAVGVCDNSSYVVSNAAALPLSQAVSTGVGQGSWSGLTLAMNNLGTNQDGCKGATVTITYTVAAGV